MIKILKQFPIQLSLDLDNVVEFGKYSSWKWEEKLYGVYYNKENTRYILMFDETEEDINGVITFIQTINNSDAERFLRFYNRQVKLNLLNND